jgi:CheY-like chemotaxis protein
VTTAQGDGDGFDEEGFTVVAGTRRKFLVLNDAPIGEAGNEDLLGTEATARRLADLLLDSRAAAPFTLAVDAAWGAGKSSLLLAIDTVLRDTPEVRTVWFNAWTAERVDALEGLIKSVLLSFDRNVIRRAVRKLARHDRLISGLRAAVLVVVSFVGLHRVIDDLWQRLTVDATSRNRIRDVVHGMATSWLARSKTDALRLLVVFVDDLDRCTHAQIVRVCEAMKLYLDVPGIVFVLACDGDVVLRAVRDQPGADHAAMEAGYLDKIIQVTYRVNPPSARRARRLVDGYAVRSGTDDLFDDGMRRLLIERTGGNPRAIKRLINTFVLEYHLRPEWDQAGPENLLKLILLQQFYPGFYRLFIDSLDTDPIGDFLAYREFRLATGVGQLTPSATARAGELFARKDIAAPDPAALDSSLARLEKQLPAEFVRLGGEAEFASLLAGLVGPVNTAMVRRVLRRRSLTAAHKPPQVTIDHSTELDGLRVLWVDDHATDEFSLAHELRRRGAEVAIANDRAAAANQFRIFEPTALVSDLHRYGDDNAGFADLEWFRAGGLYRGPVIFYTSQLDEQRQRRADELSARITTSLSNVLEWLR